MGKSKQYPRYEVVSMRVTYEEKEIIEKFSRRAKVSVSNALREAAAQAGLFKGGQDG